MNATVVLGSTNTTTGRRVEDGHMGGSRGNQGDEEDNSSSELHC